MAIANPMVRMFVDCGSANNAVDMLGHKNDSSWTPLKFGTTQNVTLLPDAFVFDHKTADSFSHAYVSKGKACTTGAVQDSRANIIEERLLVDVTVCNILDSVFAKDDSMVESHDPSNNFPEHERPKSELPSVEEEREIITSAYRLPSLESIICSLQDCRTRRDLACAKQAYTLVCSNGLEAQKSIGNFVVPMYVDCGSMQDAWQAFHRILSRNEHSWTSLMAGFVLYGQPAQSLSIYPLMQGDCIPPSVHSFTALLKACGKLKDISSGHEIHTETVKKGFENLTSIGNTIVTMYAKCGFLSEAQEVFVNIPVRDVVSWTALITGYTEHGHGQESLKLCEKMKVEGSFPNAFTFASALKACCSLGALEEGRKLHTELRHQGLEQNLFIGSLLIGMYAKCDSFLEAREVFGRLRDRDVVTWTALIDGLAECGCCQEALDCFVEMQLECITPSTVTFAAVLKACGTTRAIDKGRDLHAEIEMKGLFEDPSVGNSLISMYTNCGSILEARQVFEVLPVRDVISWNAMIAGCCEYGYGQEGLQLFEELQLSDTSPNIVTYVCALRACGSIRAMHKGQQIHMEIRQRGLESSDLLLSNSLVGMYAKCGAFEKAEEVFYNLPIQNPVTWNALIGGYAHYGLNQQALDGFERMKSRGCPPDAVTFSCILKVCGSMAALRTGQEIHSQAIEMGFADDSCVCKSLMGMYVRCGSLSEARNSFHKLIVQDVEAWSLLIKGCGMNNEGNLGELYFKEMIEHGMLPDAVTFTCLFSACRHGSLVLKGMEYFKTMREMYSVSPSAEHYNCIIDLLGRSGRLYEAEMFLDMLCPESEEMWSALLSSCKTYGEIQLGLRCFQRLVQINPDDSAWYVLMAHMYGCAGRLHDSYKVEDLRKLLGAKKKAAVALIEVNNKVHEFVVGNGLNSEVSTLLQSLRVSMKHEEHLPNLDVVLKPIGDEDKEAALCEHAEKLAIAFGLLSTPHGTTIRVSKNLRMCGDCHNVSKLVSRIEKREIIIRDASCVHHFKDNLCSCGDLY